MRRDVHRVTELARSVGPNLRQGLEGIALVVVMTGVVAFLGWLLALVIAWVY